MRRVICLFVFFCCFSPAVYTQHRGGFNSPDHPQKKLMSRSLGMGIANGGIASPLSWTRSYDGIEGAEDFAYAAVSDSMGNVIVAGWTQVKASGFDILVVKYDKDGNRVWAKSWDNANGDDFGYIIKTDSKDNVIVVGPTVSAGNNNDIAVIKLDPFGALKWANVYDGPANGYDWVSDICALAVDGLDNAVLVGTSPGISTGNDMIIVKYAPDGTLLWEQRFHNPAGTSDSGSAITIDDLNEIYVGGTTRQPDADFLANKYDASGALIWSSTYDSGASHNEYAYDLVVDHAYNVILTGLSKPSHEGDFLTIKLDPLGDLKWARTYDSSGCYDLPFSVAVDHQGNIGVTGVSQTYFSGSVTTTYYQKDGTMLWAKHQKGSPSWAGDNAAFDLQFDQEGNAHVAGYLYMGVQNGFDAACFGYAPNGDLIGQARFNGASGGNDYFYGVHVDNGSVFGLGVTTNAQGSPDMLTMKVDYHAKTKVSP